MTREQFDAITEAFAKLNNVDIDTAGELVAEIGDVHILAENGRVIAAGKTWLWPDDLEGNPDDGKGDSTPSDEKVYIYAVGSSYKRELTSEEVAALDKQWKELFNENCEPRFMEQVRRGSPEQRAALLALAEITPERWKEKFTTEEEDWEPVPCESPKAALASLPQNGKTITAIFTGPDAAHIAMAKASFATLPGSAHVEWTIPPGAPELKSQPATAYAETFESEMRALAAASGATVEIAERGEWAELAE